MLEPAPDVFAIVDAGGSVIKFVDEITLAIDSVDIGHAADTDSGTRLLAWLEETDSVLVLVYGSPISGDVARVDVKRKKVLSVSSPEVCKER
jgi:Cu2+-containing amine oxidase